MWYRKLTRRILLAQPIFWHDRRSLQHSLPLVLCLWMETINDHIQWSAGIYVMHYLYHFKPLFNFISSGYLLARLWEAYIRTYLHLWAWGPYAHYGHPVIISKYHCQYYNAQRASPLSVDYTIIRPNNEDIFKRPQDSKWLKGTMITFLNLQLRPHYVQINAFARQKRIKLLKKRVTKSTATGKEVDNTMATWKQKKV